MFVCSEMIKALTQLKLRNPKLKIMIAIGGWNEKTADFSQILSSEENMRRFTVEAIKFLRQHYIDGIDIEFEYPGERGSPPEDRQRFTEWMQMMSKEFIEEEKQNNGENPKLVLSMAAGVTKHVIDTSYDIKELNDACDFITLMTYDYHGGWEHQTGFNAPLYDSTERNVQWSVNYWLQKGADASKITIGIPAYGRSYRLCANVTTSEPGVGEAACEKGAPGVFTSEAGVNAYFEVRNLPRYMFPSFFVNTSKPEAPFFIVLITC